MTICINIIRAQLASSPQLKAMMPFVEQDFVHKGEPRSYPKLRAMVANHLQNRLAKKNRAVMDAGAPFGIPGAQPTASPKTKPKAKANVKLRKKEKAAKFPRQGMPCLALPWILALPNFQLANL